jgi:hypothetical protein
MIPLMNHLSYTFAAVQAKREANVDVFVWPDVEWCLLYTHEELTELARVVQKINQPDHARNSDDNGLSLEDRLHTEWGQAYMMLATTGLVLGINPDKALRLALDKIDRTSQRKRAEAQP